MACSRAVSSAVVLCPIGKLHLTACAVGLHEIRNEQAVVAENFAPVGGKQQPVVMETKDVSNEALQDTFAWLQKYFAREKADKTPTLCMSNNGGDDSFMVKCWKMLEGMVPFGQTATYGQLAADMADNPKAARAIGQAMRRNKWILIVPCHRVVRSDGSLGQYGGGGVSIKRWLIDFEKSG